MCEFACCRTKGEGPALLWFMNERQLWVWELFRATDCANIFSLACKLLLSLGEKKLRATDEPCFFCAARAIMRRAMSHAFSISGTAGSTQARWVVVCETLLSEIAGRGNRIPPRSHLKFVGYPTLIPPRSVGYPTAIPTGLWDQSGIAPRKSFRFGDSIKNGFSFDES